MQHFRTTVASVEQLEDFDDDYVYDIGVASDDPYFFANDILVHNSCYFSAYRVLKDNPEYADFDWSRENIIELYDLIADEANQTFPEFMQRTFNTSLERGGIIKAGRELVGGRGLFIKKKKYAVLMYDKEGKRLDKDGKPGKLKVMGLDLKRSDTPKYMQDFLEKLLMDVLCGKSQVEMYDDIKQFRNTFKTRPGWEKGSPKKVAGLSGYAAKLKEGNKKFDEKNMYASETAKVRLPGHVLASMNWNTLCDIHKDRYAARITDGTRIIVCKLKKNTYDMTSVAYPIDEPNLPEWFRELPFDDEAMEETIIDKKITNLVGVLEWDLAETKERSGDEFFSFS